MTSFDLTGALWGRLSLDHYLRFTSGASEAQGEGWTCLGSRIQLAIKLRPKPRALGLRLGYFLPPLLSL